MYNFNLASTCATRIGPPLAGRAARPAGARRYVGVAHTGAVTAPAAAPLPVGAQNTLQAMLQLPEFCISYTPAAPRRRDDWRCCQREDSGPGGRREAPRAARRAWSTGSPEEARRGAARCCAARRGAASAVQTNPGRGCFYPAFPPKTANDARLSRNAVAAACIPAGPLPCGSPGSVVEQVGGTTACHGGSLPCRRRPPQAAGPLPRAARLASRPN